MKKVLQTLFLISFCAILLMPAIILAEPTCPNCQIPTANCSCGANVLSPTGGLYCYNSVVYNSLSACQAQTGGGTGSGSPEQIPTPFSTAGGLIDWVERIGNWIFAGLLALASIYLVVAGYYFVTAQADPEKIKKAREILIQALIGVAVAVAARGLVMVIKNLVGS